MRRAVTTDPPAIRLNRAFQSAAVLPLLFTLGAGAPSDPNEGNTNNPPVSETAAPEAVLVALQDEAEIPQEGSSATVDGYLNMRWRSRWTEDSGDEDHDLFGVVGIDVDSGGENPWGFHLLGRGAWSVENQDPGSVFYSVQDSYNGDVTGSLYHAYFDLPFKEQFGVARLGRMLIHETPETAHFDGVQFETQPNGPTRFSFGAYGGSSVHLFEDWPSDEWLAGAYTTFRPWERGTLRVDWMHFEDDARVGTGDNDLITVGLEHRPIDELRLEGEYSMLDGKNRDMRLKGMVLMPEQALTVRLSYYRLLEPQLNYAYELNPYYNFLNVYHPYDQGQIVVSKVFSQTFELMGGFDVRRVDQQDDIGQFNRDFDRYYVTAALLEILPLSTTISVTGEVWESPGNDISTWGADLTSQFNEVSRFSFGSFYSLYKYQWDVNSEREDVRTYYGEFKREVSESAAFKVRYEYEDEPIDSFHSVRVGLTWQF